MSTESSDLRYGYRWIQAAFKALPPVTEDVPTRKFFLEAPTCPVVPACSFNVQIFNEHPSKPQHFLFSENRTALPENWDNLLKVIRLWEIGYRSDWDIKVNTSP